MGGLLNVDTQTDHVKVRHSHPFFSVLFRRPGRIDTSPVWLTSLPKVWGVTLSENICLNKFLLLLIQRFLKF